jgi:hypothetical protein
MVSMSASAQNAPRLLRIIAGATILIGTLDIADAIIFYGLRGISATRILQSIASGVLGRAAFSGGMHAALLGLALHFFIACCVATFYLLASTRLPLFRHPILYGTLYGLVVYGIMNYMVLPLSRTSPRPLLPPLVVLINGVAALIVCIGIPVAFIAQRSMLRPGDAESYAR